MSEKYATHRSESYHSDPDNCPTVNKPERHVKRSETFIERRDLEPCSYCYASEIGPEKGAEMPNLRLRIRANPEEFDLEWYHVVTVRYY